MLRGFTFALLVCFSLQGHATQYRIFTTTFLPPINTHGLNVPIYRLDETDLIVSQLGHFRPSSQQRAQESVLAFLGSAQGKALLADLERSFQGTIIAWSHKIKRLPAILIDDAFLIYGVYDLNQAQRLYEAFDGRDRRE